MLELGVEPDDLYCIILSKAFLFWMDTMLIQFLFTVIYICQTENVVFYHLRSEVSKGLIIALLLYGYKGTPLIIAL
jgi:hypothetical protein